MVKTCRDDIKDPTQPQVTGTSLGYRNNAIHGHCAIFVGPPIILLPTALVVPQFSAEVNIFDLVETDGRESNFLYRQQIYTNQSYKFYIISNIVV